MDNLCHTLVGLAMAKAGLDRRTRYATATLVIGANFPDIDVIAVPLGHAIGWRRGLTHGVLALAVLPFLLTGLVLLWDRWRRRRRGDTGARPIPTQLLLLSFLSILTHPALDFMNTYGVRWLSPFSDRWFYADTLFIVDIWLWLVLLAGVLVPWLMRGRIARPERPPRIALVVSAIYVTTMVMAAARARHRIIGEIATPGAATTPSALMVAPVPINPIRRDVVIEEDTHYRFATSSVLGAPLVLDGTLEKGDVDPDVTRALQHPKARAFLHWARFPFFRVERAASRTLVHIADARYTRSVTGSWASVTIDLPSRVAALADSAASNAH